MNDVASSNAGPCVWMTAGLVSYKLCDRDFECLRCPLDSALRGGGDVNDADAAFTSHQARHRYDFPDDRRYGPGQIWIANSPDQPAPVVRIGLDAFAATLMPAPLSIKIEEGAHIERGDTLAALECREGTYRVCAPSAARVVRANPNLKQRPELLIESPYEDGWLAEIDSSSDRQQPVEFMDAPAARHYAALLQRQLRRRIALHVLADSDPVGTTLNDGGEPVTTLADLLGGRRYLEILRDILR